MATNKTENLGLAKLAPTDFYDLNIWNANMNIIDAFAGAATNIKAAPLLTIDTADELEGASADLAWVRNGSENGLAGFYARAEGEAHRFVGPLTLGGGGDSGGSNLEQRIAALESLFNGLAAALGIQ